MEKIIVKTDTNLRDFISANINISKKKAKELIDSRNVFVNNRRVWIAAYKLEKGDRVEIYLNPLTVNGNTVPLNVLYEDQYIIAVDKPSGILSNGDSKSLESLLREKFINPEIQAVHRLDKDTSGVILFAKNADILKNFKEMWRNETVEKTYLAISINEAESRSFIIDNNIDGKRAVTKVKLIDKKNGFSFFELKIETGRKHQIRIHLASIRHPILGDKEYGMKVLKSSVGKKITRHMLHSYRISYLCPFTNRQIDIKSDLPGDFKYTLTELKLSKT